MWKYVPFERTSEIILKCHIKKAYCFRRFIIFYEVVNSSYVSTVYAFILTNTGTTFDSFYENQWKGIIYDREVATVEIRHVFMHLLNILWFYGNLLLS